MQFEYDPERLIEEVKKRPGIWDYDDPEYRNKIVRYKLWGEIVNELMQPNIKVSKSEMRELEIQLQKKWKGIRDCFQKFVTKKSKSKRPYLYHKQLQFLVKNLEDSQSKGDGDSSDSDELVKPKRVWRAKKKMKLVKNEETSEEEASNTFDVTMEDSREYSNDESETIRSAKVAKGNKNLVDEFVFANVDAQVKPDAEDSDKMFLLSLLPHLKTIPEEFRLNVKMELMQVLRNANYGTVREFKIM